jgi:hypothetical protein
LKGTGFFERYGLVLKGTGLFEGCGLRWTVRACLKVKASMKVKASLKGKASTKGTGFSPYINGANSTGL